MRLETIRHYLDSRGMRYQYREEDDCGAIDFEHRGLRYTSGSSRHRSGAPKAMCSAPAGPWNTTGTTSRPFCPFCKAGKPLNDPLFWQ